MTCITWSNRVPLGIGWHTQIGRLNWEFIRDYLQGWAGFTKSITRWGSTLGLFAVRSFCSPRSGGTRVGEATGKPRTSEGGWEAQSGCSTGAQQEQGLQGRAPVTWEKPAGAVNTLTLCAGSLVSHHLPTAPTQREVTGLEATLCHPQEAGARRGCGSGRVGVEGRMEDAQHRCTASRLQVKEGLTPLSLHGEGLARTYNITTDRRASSYTVSWTKKRNSCFFCLVVIILWEGSVFYSSQ